MVSTKRNTIGVVIQEIDMDRLIIPTLNISIGGKYYWYTASTMMFPRIYDKILVEIVSFITIQGVVSNIELKILIDSIGYRRGSTYNYEAEVNTELACNFLRKIT